jgi:hypothetical protein
VGDVQKFEAWLKVQNVTRKSYELGTKKRKKNTDQKIMAQPRKQETPKNKQYAIKGN